MRGWFITLEGGEGAGKSTMLEQTHQWLLNEGYTVVKTREPGGTATAERIRAIVLDRENTVLCPLTELLLVFAARAQHLDELIRPALGQGTTVLCDRFTDASWAYQGGGRGLPAETLAALEKAVHGDLQPDLTLLLDLPVSLGLQRIARRGATDRIENETVEFFERVRQSYLARAAASPQRFAIIDASVDENAVWRQMEWVLKARLVR